MEITWKGDAIILCGMLFYVATTLFQVVNSFSSDATHKIITKKYTDEEVLCKELKVLNPITNRYIKQTGYDSKSKKTKWHELMFSKGGWVAYQSKLTSIQLDNLVQWEKEKAMDHDKFELSENTNINESYKYHPCLQWRVLSPVVHDIQVTLESKSGNSIEEKYDIEKLPCFDQLLFVHKPGELLTLPGIGDAKQICLASEVNRWLEESEHSGKEIMQEAMLSSKRNRIQKPEKRFNKKSKEKVFLPRPCHRLDLDTSGAMVMALTPDALRLTSKMFEDRYVQKTYVALVAGHIEEDQGSVEYPIGKVISLNGDYNEFLCYKPKEVENEHKTNAVGKEVCTHDISRFIDKSLREAKTEWSVLQRFTIYTDSGGEAKYTRVALKPLTGRGHQLRIHCAAIGHALLGDNLHAPQLIAEASPILCLHAETLEMMCLVSTDAVLQPATVTVTSISPF